MLERDVIVPFDMIALRIIVLAHLTQTLIKFLKQQTTSTMSIGRRDQPWLDDSRATLSLHQCFACICRWTTHEQNAA